MLRIFGARTFLNIQTIAGMVLEFLWHGGEGCANESELVGGSKIIRATRHLIEGLKVRIYFISRILTNKARDVSCSLSHQQVEYHSVRSMTADNLNQQHKVKVVSREYYKQDTGEYPRGELRSVNNQLQRMLWRYALYWHYTMKCSYLYV